MTSTALAALDQVIAALTCDEIEQHPGNGASVLRNEQVPLLHRSISHDLILIERVIGGRGKTLLSPLAVAIRRGETLQSRLRM